MSNISRVLVLGGGSAGLLNAITFRRKLPALEVTVVRSPAIGVISVGEGTTFTIPNYLHGYLGIDVGRFHREVRPTYKLGIRFLWGPRPYFNYTFTSQLDCRYQELPRPNGYYCDEQFDYADLNSALMAHDRAFERQPDGGPLVTANVAYHLENARLVSFLEQAALDAGVVLVDDTVENVEVGEQGVAALQLTSGRRLSADLYLDCSGFRGELLSRVLEEPFVEFKSSLFCDRAVVGGWPRSTEPVKPYTTAETMDSGWCWQIEHDASINRGYVYSSAFLSDDEAEHEFRAKNPRVDQTRIVRFVSGRYERAWVKNVVAMGNAAGFVEPLESTSLAIICDHAAALVKTLLDSDLEFRPRQIEMFNRYNASNWDAVRGFLALHYKFNTRLDTPFWRACRADADLHGARGLVEFYQENGPSRLWSRQLIGAGDPFGWEGYLTLLVGQRVPYAHRPAISEQEAARWRGVKASLRERAQAAMAQEEALAALRSENWRWRPDFYTAASQW